MRLSCDVDTTRLLKALDDLAGPVLDRYVDTAAKLTASRVAEDARARVRRRTGRTARGIVITEARVGKGYVVMATNPEQPGLPGWLEFGTSRLPRREFFFVSAAVNAGDHDRRMRDAIQDAIDEVGLGE